MFDVVLAQATTGFWGNVASAVAGGSVTIILAVIAYFQFSKQWKIDKQTADQKAAEGFLAASGSFIGSLQETISELRERMREMESRQDVMRIEFNREIDELRAHNRTLEDDNSRLNRRVSELMGLSINLCHLLIETIGYQKVERMPEIMRHPELRKIVEEYHAFDTQQ